MSPSETLRARLVEAYGPHVRARLVQLGLGSRVDDRMDAALEEGERWLDDQLAALLSRPFGEQRRGPLELFQEAMRFPTEVLRARGVEPPSRDEVAVEALPGDEFDLAPASSSLLGEEVWAAHLAWGAAKAEALG